MKRLVAALTLLVAWLACAHAAAAAVCAGILTGTIPDSVTVPAHATCTLMSATVHGDVLVQSGGSLLVNAYYEPTAINGDVSADGCVAAVLTGNVTVQGSVRISGCTGTSSSGFQGPGTVVKGDFRCTQNAAACVAWLGNVEGDVAISHNGVGSDVSLVDVGGDLTCSHNAAVPTHKYGPNWVAGASRGQCADDGFVASGTSIVPPGTPTGPGMQCADLANLKNFPVPNTQIFSAVDTPASTTAGLPERCIVNGVVNSRTGPVESPVDGCTYGDSFQVQLPLPSAWNGRFMFQGGGGTEGSVPAATGSAGTASPTIAQGYAVASQDGGHENSALLQCGTKNTNEFFLDPMGTIDNAYQSIQVTALTAKYLIDRYYGKGPQHSYWVGCSTGGRQGMVMSQNFPQYFDGIVAGDPVYELEDLWALTEPFSVQQIFNLYNATPNLPPVQYIPGPSPEAPQAIVYAAFPVADQALFTAALLQTCDALDGVADGVIDNLPACDAKFDPATATYVANGMTHPLQCPGGKDATCLSPAQIRAVKAINQGPRNDAGEPLQAPAGTVAHDHSDPTAQGYRYDGGWMAPAGMPARQIGTPTSSPADYTLGLTITPYAVISPPDLGLNMVTFNFSTDLGKLSKSTPEVTASTSLDIRRFVNQGHKIIWYHGLSDPGPPVLGTKVYYDAMAKQHGGIQAAQKFSRFYPIPGMNHCGGGPATDQFDMLSPLVAWVERGTPPGPLIASGSAFTGQWQGAVGGPTMRSRPICPYPQEARYIGPTSGAAFPTSLGVASNYTCVMPAKSGGDGEDDGKGDDDRRSDR